ncbi:MAG TPA: Lrp/AsnC family transcriptional regulator [Fimbriimonadaceae bacterium]|nr:Lrp/AsnC family transcriptional regulator [Fimbriimonadaceae bacterium]
MPPGMDDLSNHSGTPVPNRGILPRLEGLAPDEGDLLLALADNARLSNAALARRLQTPASSSFNRLNSLIKRGIVSGFHTVVDRRKLGLTLDVLVGIELHDQQEAHVEVVTRAARQLPHVSAILRASGRYDLLVQAVITSTEVLVSEVIEPLSSLPPVRRTDTSLIAEHWRRPSLFGSFVRF